MRETAAMTERDSGIRVRLAMLVNYPSPAKLLQHRPGAGQVTMTMTLPPRLAKAALKSGRTLTISSTYRMAGLGSRSITLADPAATTVDALGVRGTMRSLKFANAKPAFARELKKEMRPMFASIFGTEWIARGRGVVQSVSTTTDGVAETQTQVSCS
ncbi:hypothetical protein GCM10009798_42110 [Nocardioides panacihumi]|uniref:SRPBCC family protein n=2 Tax=Nocardioides panacihumi TaxID=400774 RepID=A0ABN2RX15_9ACTN